MPSGFSDAQTWSAKVTWHRAALARAFIPATPEVGTEKGPRYEPILGFGLVAVTGDVVVMATLTTGHTAARTPVTLQFRNAKTGDVLASKSLDTDEFFGVRPDTLDGKAVVEVRYTLAPTTDETKFVSTVFDTSAHQLWTSAGQTVTTIMLDEGLWLLPTTNGLLSHGYLIRANPGQGEWHAGASYDVVDTTGKVIINVPYHEFFDPAHPTKPDTTTGIGLVDGYAVIDRGDTNPDGFSPPAQYAFRFIVYDLAQGGKKVAEAPESVLAVTENVHSWPRAVASCGGKIVLTWEIGSISSRSENAIRVAVLDVRTGQATTPVDVVTPLPNYPPVMSGLSDPACSTMLLYGGIFGSVPAFAINLAHGNLLWRTDHQDRYLSMHGGVTYAIRARSQPSPSGSSSATPLPGRLVSIGPDGSTLSADLAVAPLAFTADGSAVFAAMSQPAVCDPPSSTASSPSRVTSRPSPPQTRPTSCDVTVWVARATR